MKQISAVHSKDFEKLKIGLIVNKSANKISKKINFDSSKNGQRQKKIIEAVESIIKLGHSAIVIDEELGLNSFLNSNKFAS
jgi:hypothetical protein